MLTFAEVCHVKTCPKTFCQLNHVCETALHQRVPSQDPEEEKRFRMNLGLAVSGSGLYTDDGEISCGLVFPFIDFKRDEWVVIVQKLDRRARDADKEKTDGQ